MSVGTNPKEILAQWIGDVVDVVINNTALAGVLTGFDEHFLILYNQEENTRFMVNRRAIDFMYLSEKDGE